MCVAGAMIVTGVAFFSPWSSIFNTGSNLLSAIVVSASGVFFSLAKLPVVAGLVALALACFCFFFKHENNRAGKEVGKVGIVAVLTLLLTGLACVIERPDPGNLRLAQDYPEMYQRFHQLTDEQRTQLKSIWTSTRTWEEDREQTADILGPEAITMGEMKYKTFRRSINNASSNQVERVGVRGCRKAVDMYRQSNLASMTQLTVNGKLVTATSTDACKWGGFNELKLTWQGDSGGSQG